MEEGFVLTKNTVFTSAHRDVDAMVNRSELYRRAVYMAPETVKSDTFSLRFGPLFR